MKYATPHPKEFDRHRRDSPRVVRLSGIVFFTIFVGYYFYHFLCGQGYIQPYLGGYFTSICILTLPIVIFCYFNGFSGRKINSTDVVFMLFTAFFAMVVFINYSIGADSNISLSHTSYILKFFAIFMVTRSISISDSFFRRMILASYAGTTLLTILYSINNGFIYSYILPQYTSSFSEDYQGLAFVYVVISLICAYYFFSSPIRFAIYILSISSLFFIGARSEFIGFIVIVPIIEFCLARKKILFMFSTSAVAIMVVAASGLAIGMLPQNNRVTNLYDYEKDASYLERQEVLGRAIQTILNAPILGGYASHEPGKYAHNILSAWVDLGFAGFFFFLVMTSAPLAVMLQSFRSNSQHPFYALTFSALFFSLLLLLLAKAYTYQMVPFSMALFAQYCDSFRARRLTQ